MASLARAPVASPCWMRARCFTSPRRMFRLMRERMHPPSCFAKEEQNVRLAAGRLLRSFGHSIRLSALVAVAEAPEVQECRHDVCQLDHHYPHLPDRCATLDLREKRVRVRSRPPAKAPMIISN